MNDDKTTETGPATPSEPTVEESNVQSVDLDQLLDQALEGPEFEGKHKGLDYNQVLSNADSDTKKLIQNLREDYRRKTTKIAEERRALEERERHLLSDDVMDQLRKAMDIPEDLDLRQPENISRFIEAKAASQLNSLLEPQRQKVKLDKRTEQLKQFRQEHADFDDLRDDIAKLVSEKNMLVEDAYHLIKGRNFRSAIAQKDAELDQYRRHARENGYKVSVGRAPAEKKVQGKSAFDIYKQLKERNKS